MPRKIAGSARTLSLAIALAVGPSGGRAADQLAPPKAAAPGGPLAKPTPPVFVPTDRAVSSWRTEGTEHLTLSADQLAAFRDPGPAPRVARCVKLNNYWCIKKAGWDGEIAADGEGHVAFASAVEGAAVAALLLKRYYVDFNRHTAIAIISRWAPAQCGLLAGGASSAKATSGKFASLGTFANTLRGRWLAGHSRGFVTPVAGRKVAVRHSVVADHVARMMPTPTIATGLGEGGRSTRPMTLDALLRSSPDAPPSRSMLGMPRPGRGSGKRASSPGTVSACGYDGPRIAAYAAKAAAGITTGKDGDLGLFAADGAPTANLSIMMANMARVEIGPLGASPALIEAGIAAAFRPGRNPEKS